MASPSRKTKAVKSKREGTRARTRTEDAVSVLKQDHKKVMQLLNDMENTTGRATDRRTQLLKEIETEIKVHSRIEEEIFYPALKAAGRASDEHLVYEALEEHHVVDVVLAELKAAKAGSEQFGAKAKVLKDLIEHHAIEEEEGEMFPKARRIMGPARLRELGVALRERKQELQSDLLTRVARTAGSVVGQVMNRVPRKRVA